MRLKYSPQAAEDIRAAARAWRAYAKQASAWFRLDIVSTRALLKSVPKMGAVPVNARGGAIRRVLLPRTGYWLYYLVDEKRREVLVIRLWHPRRGEPRDT